jgi:hypothetical protein
MRRVLLTVVFFATAAACLIVNDESPGKVCTADADCPKVNGYFCVSSTKWPQVRCGAGEKKCTCEVTFPPPPFNGADAGPVDAGPPIDYCRDIKPVLNSTCLFTCHSAQMGYPGSPPGFRLDYWFTPMFSDGGMGTPGVSSQIPQIDAVVYTDYYNSATHNDPSQMPPVTFAAATMSEAQRNLFHRWIHAFGGSLGDGGCEVDAGMAAPDDGGTPVSFAADVKPVFMQYCISCHGGATPSAMLDLTPANAHAQLVGHATSSGCNAGGSTRVVANSLSQSMLWLKITNDPLKCNGLEPNGAAQPFSTTNVSGTQKIRDWILQGAKDN